MNLLQYIMSEIGIEEKVVGVATLKILTLDDGKWYDRDTWLLHAAFQVLVDFVEQEELGEAVEWDWNAEHEKAWSEIQALYTWWKEERPLRKNPLDEIEGPDDYMTVELLSGETDMYEPVFHDKQYPYVKEAFEKSREVERIWFEEDQRNLHRLIEIRPYLWT